MNHIVNFDVLIVYSEKLANSAGSESEAITAPFPKGSANESYNLVYGYFLKSCQRNKIKAAFTTSADIVGAGKCRSYWLFENNVWTRVQKTCFSKLIFDKFSPTTKARGKKRDLLFSSKRVKPFNNPRLFDLCFDKQKTYDALNNFSIPTVTIEENTRRGVMKAQKFLGRRVARHQNRSDFSGEIIMKDRFGAGGLNVYRFGGDQVEAMISSAKKYKNLSFIIQPFVKFDKGIRIQNFFKSADIRLIYLGQKIVQTYIRIAQKGDFRCNEHAGGLLKYISISEVPLGVIAISRKIAGIVNKIPSLLALDFIRSNTGNIYLLEANTGPGLDWNLSIRENEIEAKKLIRIIVKEIGRRVGLSSSTTERKVVVPVGDPLVYGHWHRSDLLPVASSI